MSQEGTGIEDMEDDDMDTTWIKWFCDIPGNEFFCEVDKAFIEDSFNLFGIKQVFPHDYNSALATILDRNDCRCLVQPPCELLLLTVLHRRRRREF